MYEWVTDLYDILLVTLRQLDIFITRSVTHRAPHSSPTRRSSDLPGGRTRVAQVVGRGPEAARLRPPRGGRRRAASGPRPTTCATRVRPPGRSEERRVGEECGARCVTERVINISNWRRVTSRMSYRSVTHSYI